MQPKYEYLDHTADVGFMAYGATVEALFAHAAEALIEVMTPVKDIEPMEEHHLSVDADDLETLMVRWLNELLYQFETTTLLFGHFQVHEIRNFRLSASCRGEKLDPARHEIRTGIKAVTYHGLYIKEQDDLWESRIFLDI
jgi:SHS2 domain-containing protein